MGKKSTRRAQDARAPWETLEDWVRGNVQQDIQQLLEEEVTEFLGRHKAQQRKVGLAVTPGHGESTESWAAVLRDLQQRGLPCSTLVIGDGESGRVVRQQLSEETGQSRLWLDRHDESFMTDQPCCDDRKCSVIGADIDEGVAWSQDVPQHTRQAGQLRRNAQEARVL